MDSKKRTFDFNNLKDVEKIHRMLFDDDSMMEEDFGDQSDTNSEDNVQLRDQGSETEQSLVDSSSEDENSNDVSYFIAYQKQKGKVIDSYRWSKHPPSSRKKTSKQNLLVHLPGVIGDARKAETILDSWLLLFDESILNTIVEWTNKYIDLVRPEFTRARDARSTDIIEIKAFIGLLYLAGVYRGSRLNLEDLWDTSGDGIETFRLTMSQRRFRFLIRCIRFDNRDTREERRKLDRLASIRDVFGKFIFNCQKCYSLGDNVTLDEKLEAFRGRCCFRQYIPSKPAKYGIKIFALVDSKVYYTYNLEIYAGKQPDGQYAVSNKCTDVVHRMVSPIVNTGRNLTVDNWFSDVPLMSDLINKKISLVATLKKNKWQIPEELRKVGKRNEKSSIFGFRKEGTIVSYVPRKNKNVVLISSFHFNDAIDESTGSHKKPEIVTYYNETKGAVDTVDKLCATYNVARNVRRWPMVIFFALLNVAGINAQIIYSGNGNNVKNRRTFLRQLAKCLVMDEMTRRSSEKKNLPLALRLRLTEITKKSSQATEVTPLESTKKRKLCEPCQNNKQRKNTKYTCASCGKYLCLSHVITVCNDCHATTNFSSQENISESDSL